MGINAGQSSGKFPGLSLKAWAYFNPATGALIKSSGVTSVTRNAAGDYTVNITAAMGSTLFMVDLLTQWSAAIQPSAVECRTTAVSTVAAGVKLYVSGTPTDPAGGVYVGCYE